MIVYGGFLLQAPGVKWVTLDLRHYARVNSCVPDTFSLGNLGSQYGVLRLNTDHGLVLSPLPETSGIISS